MIKPLDLTINLKSYTMVIESSKIQMMRKPTAKKTCVLKQNSSTEKVPFWFVTAMGHPFKKHLLRTYVLSSTRKNIYKSKEKTL